MTDRTCTIDNCERAFLARGWCRHHYHRWRRFGDPLATGQPQVHDNATPEERLQFVGWTKRAVRDGLDPCWEWRGARDRKGYGRVSYGPAITGAHRLAYMA